MNLSPIHEAKPPPVPAAQYHCGSLTYTKAGIFSLFTWLLWGDFCFSLMETVWPAVLPVTLKSLQAPNTVLSLVITTIPSAMNFLLNPIISTASDRFRSRFGRRIPFLLFATPFVSLLLILLGFSRELGTLIHQATTRFLPQFPVVTVTLILICLLVTGFRFFELFVNTVYWYLFNDVVPPPLMGRFLGFVRIIGALAGALFNFFIFRYAESHASMIFLGAAVLYGVSFLLMCWKVREGQYPPPDPISTKKGNPFEAIRTFFRECFSHSVFVFVFLATAFWMAGYCVIPFMIFYGTSVGLTFDEIGKVSGIGGLIGVLLMYPAGVMIDRFHPLRVMIVSQILLCLLTPLGLVYLFADFSHPVSLALYAASTGLSIPVVMIYLAASFPMLMRIFPHERFGQFCSANAMCSSAATIAGGALSGMLLDLLKRASPAGDFYYRYVPVWTAGFFILALLGLLAVFKKWKQLGGDASYRPPIADKFSEFYQQPSQS